MRTRGRPGTGAVRFGPTRRPRCCRETAATREVSRGRRLLSHHIDTRARARHVMTLRAPDAAHTDTRLLEQARLLQELPLLDLQCAWLLLAMCASPRADHLLRTLPPDLSASYVRGHDDAVWRGACRVKKTTLIPRSLQHAVSRCCRLVREA